MARWNERPDWNPPSIINNGQEVTSADGFLASDMVKAIENIIYLYNIHQEPAVDVRVGTVTTITGAAGSSASVEITRRAEKDVIYLDFKLTTPTGKDGYGVFATNATVTANTASIAISSISVPDNRPLQVGDLIFSRAGNSFTTISSINITNGTVNLKDYKNVKGDAGNGISSTVITYAASASNTVVPANWSSTIPSVVAGNYLWTRTVLNYTNGTFSTSYSIARQGGAGEFNITYEEINKI